MNLRSLISLLLVAGFTAAGMNVRAADAPAKPTTTPPVAAKPDKPTPTDVKQAIDQFNAKRDAMIADRQAQLDQLKNATAEQKKAILDQMQAAQKYLLDAQRALGRQIRDELRKLRQSQPGGGKS